MKISEVVIGYLITMSHIVASKTLGKAHRQVWLARFPPAHVSLPRSRTRPPKLWWHLGISPKILVETVVLKGSAPPTAKRFCLSPSQSLVRESVSKIFREFSFF